MISDMHMMASEKKKKRIKKGRETKRLPYMLVYCQTKNLPFFFFFLFLEGEHYRSKKETQHMYKQLEKKLDELLIVTFSNQRLVDGVLETRVIRKMSDPLQ